MSGTVKFTVPWQKGEYEYIGFDLESNAGKFIFPCQYIQEDIVKNEDSESDKIFKTEAKKIVSLIKKVQTEFSLGGSDDEMFQFYSMIWLIRDFIDHGYYTEKERITRRGENGRIDWKHTLRHSGIFYDGNNLLYRDFYIQKNMLDEANLLSQIYKCCLAYSADCLGFLYNVTKTEPSVFQMHSKNDISFMTYHIQRELGRTFNTYKLLLLRHLLTILKSRQGKVKTISLCMQDKEFEYVFEFLINSVFGTENVRDFYNEYGYEIGGERISAAKLRPDTIMKNPGNNDPDYFVIDAKYYNYGYTYSNRDLPQASAIAKQIGYNYYLHENWDDETGKKNTFYSVFLLPFSKAQNLIGEAGNAIECIGYATHIEGKKSVSQKNNMNKVAVCLVDLKTLVDIYFNVAKTNTGKTIGAKDLQYALYEAVRVVF